MKCHMLSLLNSLDLGGKMLAAQEFTWLSSLKQEKSSLYIQRASKEILVRSRTCSPFMHTKIDFLGGP
jgi:hypothetical protein